MKLIVGLGNPGENYKLTRHNIGFIYIDEYLKNNGVGVRDYKKKFKGEIVEFESGCKMPKWYADAWKLPKEERSKLRSKTFPGIAQAMADQWSVAIACT